VGVIGYSVVSLAERPDLRERLPFGAGWPEFIFHDPVARRLMPDVDRLFADFNLALLGGDDAVVAGGWGVPLSWDGTVAGLPAGWDGALERAVEGNAAGTAPDTICAMASEVVAGHRGEGLGGAVLRALRACGADHGLTRMNAPARPTLKDRYPLTPIERYAGWADPDGVPFDPWLRTHHRCGARVLAPVAEAMRIAGTVAEWEEWTGMALPESGSYVVPDALAPLTVDRERDEAVYVEPGVWMLHL
jgi:GNAT superfamily N-acetyltransferase